MIRSALILFIFLFLLSGCDIRKREQELQKKEAELNQREQELILREKTLQLQQEELAQKKNKIDSSLNVMQKDSGIYNPDLIGNWAVKMICTETSCPGSAVGDTKTEQWQINYQNNNNVIAQVTDNNKLVRVYSGKFSSNTLELSVQQNNVAEQQNVTMGVRLRQTDKNHLEGRREISRAGECKIIYSIDMVKQQQQSLIP